MAENRISEVATRVAGVNRQFRLAARPVGLPKAGDWQYVEEPILKPADGEALVETLYLSLDPAMRGWMNDRKSYIAPVQIGAVMRAGGVGRVLASRDASLRPGEYVSGSLGVQTHAALPAARLTRVDTRIAPLPVYLSALGMPGMTAYFGLLDVGRPEAGNTVVVSAAAGAVGSIAGQIAKIHGCRVVGIAGGPAKCQHVVRELGFDAAIDYKAADLKRELRAHCPDGVDVYFDNVGGDTLDVVLTQLALNARVVICGAISQYNSTAPVTGPANYLSLLVNRARMQGFVIFDYAHRYAEAQAALAAWLAAGKLKTREDIVVGFERFPDAFLKLFRGENFGKLLLQVSEERAA
jgi:NADPH-dependent curcumin reductase CurA